MLKATQEKKQSMRGVPVAVEKEDDWKDLPANLRSLRGVQNNLNMNMSCKNQPLNMTE